MLIQLLRSKLKGICLKLHSSNVTDVRYFYGWSLLLKPLPTMNWPALCNWTNASMLHLFNLISGCCY